MELQVALPSMATERTWAPPASLASGDLRAAAKALLREEPSWTAASFGAIAGLARSNRAM